MSKLFISWFLYVCMHAVLSSFPSHVLSFFLSFFVSLLTYVRSRTALIRPTTTDVPHVQTDGPQQTLRYPPLWRGGSSRQTGFTGHTTHRGCARSCPGRSLISEQNQEKNQGPAGKPPFSFLSLSLSLSQMSTAGLDVHWFIRQGQHAQEASCRGEEGT